MKDEFFEKVLHVVEGRPFKTTVARDGHEYRAVAQIREGEQGEQTVVLQDEKGPLLGPNDAEVTIALPNPDYFEPFGMATVPYESTDSLGDRTVPLCPDQNRGFAFPDGQTKRIINAESIELVEPVRAKTLTLWYENIWAEFWTTNVDKEAVTVSYGGFSKTEIPPHGSTEFFLEVKRSEQDRPPIEWDIGDTHQGVIVRTDQENPVVKIAVAPADDRDITWGEYVARSWVEHGEYEIKDVGFHVWRIDEAEMDLTEINLLEQAVSHSLSFMNGTWCRPKVAIAWKEGWSESQWWGTWSPVWGAWKPAPAAKKNRHKNWTPIEVGFEKVLQETLRHISENDYGVVERYVHNVAALDNGDWISSVTASVAILQRIANNAGFDREKSGRELWKQIAGYLTSKPIERPYHYVEWGEEAERLIEGGEPHVNLVKAITELRNHVTGHWLKDEIPGNATWLAEQAIYYVEAAMRAELAPGVPMWDRTRSFHHPPIAGSSV